jgi:general secretion pathway protein D
VELNDENQAGINWSALTSNGSFSYGQNFSGTNNVLQSTAGLVAINASSLGRDFSLGSTLKLLERFGNSKVLSSPKIVGLNNQATLLKVVKNVIYFTTVATPPTYNQNGVLTSPTTYTTRPESVPVGLVLTLLPSINEFNEITLVVRPTISSIVDEIEDPNPIFKDKNLTTPISSKVPVIQEREMESVLKLNDGQIAILGGLIQDKIGGEDTGVPGLVGEPTMGYLFGQKNKSKSKSELVIFLKPVLVKHPDIEQGSLSDKKHLLPSYNR